MMVENHVITEMSNERDTHSFTKQEVEWLAGGLGARYGLNCWLKPNKNKWIIVISMKKIYIFFNGMTIKG